MTLNKLIIVYSLSVCSLGYTALSGNIYDKKTNETLTGVKIIINKKDTVYSDFNGYFKFNNIDSLKHIEISYPSYSSDDIEIIK